MPEPVRGEGYRPSGNRLSPGSEQPRLTVDDVWAENGNAPARLASPGACRWSRWTDFAPAHPLPASDSAPFWNAFVGLSTSPNCLQFANLVSPHGESQSSCCERRIIDQRYGTTDSLHTRIGLQGGIHQIDSRWCSKSVDAVPVRNCAPCPPGRRQAPKPADLPERGRPGSKAPHLLSSEPRTLDAARE